MRHVNDRGGAGLGDLGQQGERLRVRPGGDETVYGYEATGSGSWGVRGIRVRGYRVALTHG